MKPDIFTKLVKHSVLYLGKPLKSKIRAYCSDGQSHVRNTLPERRLAVAEVMVLQAAYIIRR